MTASEWLGYFVVVAVFLPKSQATDYRVDVTTVDKQHVGPDSVTYITVEGTAGKLGRRRWLPTGVQKARLDTLAIDGERDIGVVCRVNLASGSNDSWFVGTVFVRIDNINVRSQVFIFNQWLTDHSVISRFFKVHGGWAQWSPWNPCQCKPGDMQARRRSCDTPQPGCGGEPCAGDKVETRKCVNTTCADAPRSGETRTQSTDLLPWILAIVGCLILIVILVVLLVTLCCRYRKQQATYRQFRNAEHSAYANANHNKVPPNEISFIYNGIPHGDLLVTPRGDRASSTYAGSLSNVDRDSGIMVKGREPDSEPKYDEQNNCVDYVYYTYNYGGKGKDASGNAPMFVPCAKQATRPSQWEVNDMYETNVTVL